MPNLLRTLRTTCRALARSPYFALTAVVTLAFGIGLSTAMFTIVRSVLLAPLPFTAPDRLVAIAFQYPREAPSTAQVGTAIDFLRSNVHSFSAIGWAERGPTGVNLATSAAGVTHAMPVQQFRISHTFLQTLGVHPALGRDFTAEENTYHGPRAALLSDALWHSEFHADPAILGHLIRLDGTAVPVVGVLPPDALADLLGPSREDGPTGILQPLQMSPKDAGYEGTNYQMIARLRDGVSLPAAQAELDSLLPAFARENSWYSRWRMPDGTLNHFGVGPLQTALTGDVRGSLWTLLGSVLSVLLVACLNLAGLTVARATARTRELAVRSALGARRAHLLSLVLFESLLLAGAGALGGLLVAHFAATAFLAYAPLSLPRFQAHAAVLPAVLAATLLAAGSMVLFGLLPAMLVLRRNINASLRTAGSQGASARSGRGSRALVIAQIALASLLLSASSLLWSTFLRLRSTSPGLRADHLAVAQLTLKGDRYSTNLATTQFLQGVLDRLAAQPGIQAVAAVNGLPLDHGLNISGWPVGRRELARSIEVRFTTPTYLRTIGVDLLSGRDFSSTDTATSPRVAVISQAAARRWWPGRSPLGERVDVGDETEYEIVGVSRDTHETSLADTPPILVYVPLTQTDDRFTKMINNWFPTTVVARVADGVVITPTLRAALDDLDPGLPIARLSTMQAVVDRTTEAPRFLSWLSTSFAAFTLLLTTLGLFGLLSYQVTQRTREIAVRMALGATRSTVVAGVLRGGLTLTAVGLAIGLGAALLLPRVLDPLLATYVVTNGNASNSLIDLPQQLQTALLAALLLLLATLAACALPTGRAAGTEPALALRAD